MSAVVTLPLEIQKSNSRMLPVMRPDRPVISPHPKIELIPDIHCVSKTIYVTFDITFGTNDSGFFIENRKTGAVRNVVTEQPSLADSQILPPKQVEVFGSPDQICYIMHVLTV